MHALGYIFWANDHHKHDIKKAIFGNFKRRDLKGQRNEKYVFFFPFLEAFHEFDFMTVNKQIHYLISLSCKPDFLGLSSTCYPPFTPAEKQ